MREKLLEWYSYNGRDLPWRETSGPYSILVSEVTLQRKPVLVARVLNGRGESLLGTLLARG
jgi:adenine-specific DNA glycosylase